MEVTRIAGDAGFFQEINCPASLEAQLVSCALEIVVDYVGIGHHLKKSLDNYDEREQKEVVDVLSFPEEELRELKRPASLKTHDLTDLNDAYRMTADPIFYGMKEGRISKLVALTQYLYEEIEGELKLVGACFSR